MASITTALVSRLLKPVSRFVAQQRKLLIDGEWVEAASGQMFDVFNPADGSRIARVPTGDRKDIDRAVRAARAAFETGPWHRMKPADRTMLLWKLADLIDEHAEELAQIESLDNGKPVRAALRGDIPGSSKIFRYMAGWATKIEGAMIPFSEAEVDTYHAYTRREPIGVVG